MQHNVADTVFSSFSRLRTGARWQSPLGLSVCELIDDTAGAVPQRPLTATGRQLVWREMDPSDPRRLRVQNREPTAVVVEAGAVIDGGMSMRALRCCSVFPAGSETTVAVEPLGGRWWNEGPLRHVGSLDPVAVALLFQATLAAEPLASSAITALSSLPPADLLIQDGAPALRNMARWLLEDDDGIVAGWILDHTPDARPWPQRFCGGDQGAPNTASPRLSRAVHEEVEYGALEAHLVEHGGAGRDLVLFPRGVCLMDRARIAVMGGRR
jgi:hypothetical protein